MKNVTVARLSRPLLLVMDKCQDEYLYHTIFGFVIPYNLGEDAYYKVYDYVGYLAGLHCWSNGHKLFSVTFEPRGVPDWVDKKGKVHMKQDSWMTRIGERCIEKLNLSYEIIIGSIDEDTYSQYVNNCDLIVGEEFFFALEEPIEDKNPSTKEAPLWDDELPF